MKGMDLCRDFYKQIFEPVCRRVAPGLFDQIVCGRFGSGSEILLLDDEISRDHNWGPRIDILLPINCSAEKINVSMMIVQSALPKRFKSYPLGVGHVGESGIAHERIDCFLLRNIGRSTPPESYIDWLEIAEADILNIVAGEVWHDPIGDFSKIRQVLSGYYPEPVWKRRIAHWCRSVSTFGMYFLNRALLREDIFFATAAISHFLRKIVELAFLLNRTYFPYVKWLYVMFQRLPSLSSEMRPLIDKILGQNLEWREKKELCEELIQTVDQYMVKVGLIKPHSPYSWSDTSGCRILDMAYAEILRTLPSEIRRVIPLERQIYRELFHTQYVTDMQPERWQALCKIA